MLVWQHLALDLINLLDVPDNKRSVFFKIAKYTDLHKIQYALDETISLSNIKFKHLYFLKIINTICPKKQI